MAIAGVGNCASSLVQGVTYYGQERTSGLISPDLAGYTCNDIDFVAAFDIDRRKVGQRLTQAIFEPPNCATRFQEDLPESNVVVQMGPVLDGVAPHMSDGSGARAFLPSDEEPVDVVGALKDSGAEVLLCYLPVGSRQAVEFYAESCLSAGVAFVNCIPTPIASDRDWSVRFEEAHLPIVGDDIKSQFGATILHRAVVALMEDRGISLKRTYQLNTGGNSDFLNMLDQSRLTDKRTSKTNSVQSQLASPLDVNAIRIGPSDFVPWLEDRKVAFIRLEAEGFGAQRMEVDIRLSVEDSPNSAGVAIDAIRWAKIALDRGWAGAVDPVCAAYMKSPPVQMRDNEAKKALARLLREAN